MLDAHELINGGRLTRELLDFKWIARRVETVQFIDSSHLERRISLDVDWDVLTDIFGRHAEAIERSRSRNGAPTVLLPLAVLKKGLLLDLDLRDSERPLQVATSDRDSVAAAGAALAVLADSYSDADKLSPAILETVRKAARSMPSRADVDLLAGYGTLGDTGVHAWRLEQDLSGNQEHDRGLWAQILNDHDEFWSILANFTASFMMMVEVATDDLPKILKLRYVETQEPARMSFGERLGWNSYYTLLEAPGVGAATREHLRMEAPPGIFIEDAFLWSLTNRLEAGQKPQPPREGRGYLKRLALRRVSVYTSGVEASQFVLALSMRANPSGFLRRSQYVVLLATTMILVGIGAELRFGTLQSLAGATAGPTVAVLLLVPTLLVAYVSREGDHQILGDLLRLPRLLIASTGVMTLASALVLVASTRTCFILGTWTIAAIWLVAVLAWLRLINARANNSISTVIASQDDTTRELLTDFE